VIDGAALRFRLIFITRILAGQDFDLPLQSPIVVNRRDSGVIDRRMIDEAGPLPEISRDIAIATL